MKNPLKWTALLLCAALLSGTLCACQTDEAESGGAPEPASAAENAGAETASPRAPAALDLTGAAAITLSDGGASVEGGGAAAEDGVVTITAAGVYALSGSTSDGRVIVDAPGEDVTLALNGADITCSYGSPLYIYKAGTATIHLMQGTENALTDGADYAFADEYASAADGEPDACLYSKADLVIEGAGSLTVTANYKNGVTGKDALRICDAALTVTAAGNGINGKDSNTIDGASVTVSCGGDAIRSTNDTDDTLGWVSVSNATLNLTAGEDGIQAETALTLSGGGCTIASGGGSGVQPAEDASAKGLKAGTTLTLDGGVYTLDCSDDAVHADGDVTVSGGTYTVSSGDDAFHAGGTLSISGGEIDVLASYEGLEGTVVEMSGGTAHIVSSDDGVNAADGAADDTAGGFGPGNAPGRGNPDCRIDISGGYLVVAAGGDGLDSNGDAAVSGGTVIVSSTGRDDGALDCDGSFAVSGGTLLAFDGGNMPQAPGEASQYTVFAGFDGPLAAGSYVSLSNGARSFVFQTPIDANSLVFSSPDLKGGETYTLSCGGAYDGQSVDGLCEGGAYSGGTDLTELTLSDFLTSYGTRAAGNPGGGPGGRPGDAPRGGRGERPMDGGAPGEFPGGGDLGTEGMREGRKNHGEQNGTPEDAEQNTPPSSPN